MESFPPLTVLFCWLRKLFQPARAVARAGKPIKNCKNLYFRDCLSFWSMTSFVLQIAHSHDSMKMIWSYAAPCLCSRNESLLLMFTRSGCKRLSKHSTLSKSESERRRWKFCGTAVDTKGKRKHAHFQWPVTGCENATSKRAIGCLLTS